jgi:hypothetical protein
MSHAICAAALFLLTLQVAVAEPVDHEMVARIRDEA